MDPMVLVQLGEKVDSPWPRGRYMLEARSWLAHRNVVMPLVERRMKVHRRERPCLDRTLLSFQYGCAVVVRAER